ncbi:DUF4355 domain-containing protein [Lacticaseibacillus saniviri]
MKVAKLKFNLQRFAEDGADVSSSTSTESDGNTDSAATSGTSTTDDEKPAGGISFESQSALDQYVKTNIKTALDEAKKGWTADQQQQKAYEDMSPEERTQFDLNKTQKELEAARLENKVITNKATITSKLGADKLPIELVDLFGNQLGADETKLNAFYDQTAKVFREAVQSAVDQRLAASAGAPGTGSGNQGSSAGASAAQARNNASKPQGIDPWATK